MVVVVWLQIIMVDGEEEEDEAGVQGGRTEKEVSRADVYRVMV